MAKSVTKIPATVSQYTSAPIAAHIKRKVAGYARVSTDHEEQLTSYEAQLDYYTRLIHEHTDWQFAGMYSDEGISGTSTKRREGFQNMIADALAGKIDLIITKSVSRFARNTVDSLSTIRLLKEHGTEVFFEKENIWTFDSKGELLITIMSSLAQEESRSISENVTWGHRKRFSDGKVFVAYSRFLGYDKGPDGTLTVNEEEAKIIRLIYAEFMAGYSFRTIARRLSNMGIKTAYGKDRWDQSTVKSILTNEKYKGDALLQKTYTQDFLTKKQVRNHGEIQQYYVEACHEAIIEPAVFDRVQDLIKKRNATKGYSGLTIFSSRIRCGDCGGWYGPKVWHSNDQYRRVVWQCNSRFLGKTRCATTHLTEDDIKAAFISAVNRLIEDRDSILVDLREVRSTFSGTEELEAEKPILAEQMNKDDEAVKAAIADNARRPQNQDEFNARLEILSAKARESKVRYEEIKKEISMRGIRNREFDRFIQTVEDLPQTFTEFNEALWSGLVDCVTVYSKDNIVFTLNSGMEIKV